MIGALLTTIAHAQTYDISNEAHFPDPTVPVNSSANPPAGNVWTYGFRDTNAGVTNKPLWADNAFNEFVAFDRAEEIGADVIGGPGSRGDLNTWCQQNFASCAGSGTEGALIHIVDYGSGLETHFRAAEDSFVKGTVHLFTDDDAPNDRATIVRFTAPAPGNYAINMTFENRAATNLAGNNPTYHVVVARTGGASDMFDVVSEGRLGPQAFDGSLGLGNGALVNVLQTVSLGADDYIELAAMGSGAFPGVPVAVYGTISVSTAIEATGDYNGNGIVDAADYTVWRDTFGQTVGTAGDGADGNSSGSVEEGDYGYWKARFGNTVPGGGATTLAVPEPGTSCMVILGLALIASRSRRRRALA